jgi:hypothetical protein
MTQFFRRSAIALAAVGALAISHATPAHAWVRGGVFFGVAPVPFFVGPPVVYPPYYYPPAYYPPPVTYSPAPGAVSGRACYSGNYVCPLDQSVPAGTACSCPTNGGGRIGGRAG